MADTLERLVGTVPDGVVPLVGYREWALPPDDEGPPRLRSLFYPTVWPHDRALGAVCLRPMIWHGRTGIGHEGVPDAMCECGIYAFREPAFDTLRGAKGPKARGVVQGWGRYVLGTSGWRCEFARVAALVRDDADPGITEEIGRRYAIPVLRSLEDVTSSVSPAERAGRRDG